MKKVFKYPIKCDSLRDAVYIIVVMAPIGAKPISVQSQGGQVCVWMEVDPGAENIAHNLYCVGTGYGTVPEEKQFLGTVQNDSFVWHLYY